MPLPPSSPVSTRLGRLAVRSTGTGPTAVLWHSMFTDSRSFTRVEATLAAARRLLVVDGPGWGRSDPLRRRTSIAECALAAVDLLDAVGERGPVDWVGNAWGGHVGYQLAATAPQRLRTLVAASSPPHPFPPGRRRQLALLSHVVRRVGAAGPLRGMVEEGMLTGATRADDPDALRLLRAGLREVDHRSLALTLRSFVVDRVDLGGELAGAPFPVLLLVGDDRSDLSPEQAREAARRCTDARVVVVPGARTLLPVEQPAAFSAAVLDFWSRHPAR